MVLLNFPVPLSVNLFLLVLIYYFSNIFQYIIFDGYKVFFVPDVSKTEYYYFFDI